MSVTNDVQIGLTYEDSKTRTYTFSNVSASALVDVESVIVSINSNPNMDFYKTFVSSGGASVVYIHKGTIISTQEEQIYP